MSDTQPVEKAWTDDDIADHAESVIADLEAFCPNRRKLYLKIYALCQEIRDDLQATIAKLTRQLAEREAWEVVPDGTYQWSDQEAIVVEGATIDVHVRPLQTFYDSFGEPHQRLIGIESIEVTLPENMRLCRRTTHAPAANGESEAAQ